MHGVYGMTGYQYDADGTRIGKGTIASMSCDPSVNGYTATNDYILDQSGEQMTEMVPSGKGWMQWSHTNVWADGALIATYDTAGLHFYLNDPLGTRRVQTDAAGYIEQNCQSLPYGDALQCPLADPTEHHFTGKERDAESGLDYFGARYYSSNMGRFMSPDWSSSPSGVPFADLSDPQSLNLYQYMRNNPLGGVDADGHCPEGDDACIAAGDGLHGTVFHNETWSKAGHQVLGAFKSLGRLLWADPSPYPKFLQSANQDEAVGGVVGPALVAPVFSVEVSIVSVTEVGPEADAALAGRANAIQAAQDTFGQSKSTTAAASVTDANGNTSVMVGSSRNSLTPSQRAALQPGETAVTGSGHAETTVINAAKSQGMTVNSVAASRPVCQTCAQAIQDVGARQITPTKPQ